MISTRKQAKRIKEIYKSDFCPLASSTLDYKRLLFGSTFRALDLEAGKAGKRSRWSLCPGGIRGTINRMTGLESGIPKGLVPAGFTYFSQMIAHDIVGETDANGLPTTLSGESEHQREVSPFLDLGSVYLEFDEALKKGIINKLGKFRLGSAVGSVSAKNDLYRPKHFKGSPLIVERRNNENIIISQVLVIWLRTHNKSVDLLRQKEQHDARENYSRARALVTLLFQRVVTDEYLPHVSDPSVYHYYFKKNKTGLYKLPVEQHFSIPLEFSMAIFRFGHSMIRSTYSLSDSRIGPLNLVDMFCTRKRLACDEVIQWKHFFETGANKPPQGAGLPDLYIVSEAGGGEGFLSKGIKAVSGIVKSMSDTVYGMFVTGEEVTSEESKASPMAGLIYSDLKASRVVPTAGDILDSLIAAKIDFPLSEYNDIYKVLGLRERDDYREYVSFNNSILKDVIDAQGKELTLDNTPLFLFTLLEASRLPFDNKPSNEVVAQPASKAHLLGPISSLVVAETLSQSIKGASINPYMPWENISFQLGEELTEVYSELTRLPSGLTMSEVLDYQK